MRLSGARSPVVLRLHPLALKAIALEHGQGACGHLEEVHVRDRRRPIGSQEECRTDSEAEEVQRTSGSPV